MAEGKKGFILYADIIHTIKKLPVEKRGELFTIILEFVNDEKGGNPKIDDLILDLVFEPIKRQLKRDLKKYESRAERSRVNGLKGGRPSKKPKEPDALVDNPKEPKKPNRLKNNPKEPKKPDTDIVIAKDTVIDSVINEKIHPALIAFRNNVFKESREQGMKDEVAKSFYEYWSAMHYESGLYLYQFTENFTLHNKLKGWQGVEDKKQDEKPHQQEYNEL